MRHDPWEYKTLQLDVEGWFSPNVPERLDTELQAHGDAGWELVNMFDLNRGHGRSSSVVAVFKRPRR